MAINFPDNPFNGQTTTFSGVTYTYNSTKNQWTANNPSTANISSSDNAPTSPSAGDLWFNSANGVMYIYYNDGSSAQWISISGYASSFDSASAISLIDSDYVQSRQTTAASTTIVTDINGLIAISSPSNGDQAYVQSNNNLYFYDSGWYKIATVSNDSPTAITGVSGSYTLDISGGTTVITAVSSDPEGFPLTWSYSTTGLGSIATISQSSNVFTITPSTNTANAGSFTLTISVTDGVNGAVSTSSTLTLQFIVANSNYTTRLLTAVDTSDNNNITDASSNNYSITVAGDLVAGTFSPYRHGGYSSYFDKTGSYVQSDIAATGTNNFTYECWVYPTDLSNYGSIFASGSASGIIGVIVSVDQWWVGHAGSIDQFVSGNQFTLNTWQHVAVVRQGNTVTGYVDGTSVGSATISASINSTLVRLGHRYNDNTTYPMKGYIRDFRVVDSAVYTGNFTPPTESLTAITNTSVLMCHLPYFIDGSANGRTITTSGNIVVSPFTQFNYAPYASDIHGGSVYFDGTGDYLQVNNSTDFAFGTGDFTVEAWVNYTTWSGSGGQAIISTGTSTSAGAA